MSSAEYSAWQTLEAIASAPTPAAIEKHVEHNEDRLLCLILAPPLCGSTVETAQDLQNKTRPT